MLEELEDLAAAVNAADGKTPSALLDAFLPKPSTFLGNRLLPLTAGHELLLSQVSHPLANGGEWKDMDVMMALFIFSKPSRELFSFIADDTFESEFFAFLDSVPSGDVAKLGDAMVSHWLKSRSTALAMESPDSNAQKKTEGSDGSSTPSAPFAQRTDGFLTWLSTTFRWRRSSP